MCALVGHMVNAGTRAYGSDVERVPVAAGTVVRIKVRMLPLAASPGKRPGHSQDQAQGAAPSAPEG